MSLFAVAVRPVRPAAATGCARDQSATAVCALSSVAHRATPFAARRVFPSSTSIRTSRRSLWAATRRIRQTSPTDCLGVRCTLSNVNSSAPCPPEGCLEEIKLEDLVKQPPLTISMTTNIFDALEMLVDNNISGMPVVDEEQGGQVVGMLSGYDLLALDATPGHLDNSDGMFPKLGRCDEFNGRKKDMWSYFLETQEKLEKAGGQTVGEIMHRATLVPPTMPLGDGADLIVQRKLARLCLVNEKKQCIGVVSRGDIMRATLRNYRWQKARLAATNSGLEPPGQSLKA
mmetsp:Transcript_12917/g.47238  ORF Transcript_12917/g.47238 Transcript_12917/m.47238 type:complete len:287 (-) Transcript_12917:1637-2497(-)